MSEQEKLRVQIFANLSLALIAAAFTTLVGITGGFALNVGKLPSGHSWTVGAVAALACGCLILSIFFGGRGVRAMEHTLQSNPSPLTGDYEGGNFNKQATMGLFGLILGVVVFFIIGYCQSQVTSEVQTLLSDMQHVQTKLNSIEGRVGRLEDFQQQSFVKILTYMQDVQTKANSLEEKINQLEEIQKRSISKSEEGSK